MSHLDAEPPQVVHNAVRTQAPRVTGPVHPAAAEQIGTEPLTGRTRLVIAHRLSTVQDADRILVIDDGRIQARGSHDQLRTGSGLYAAPIPDQFAAQPGPAPNHPKVRS